MARLKRRRSDPGGGARIRAARARRPRVQRQGGVAQGSQWSEATLQRLGWRRARGAARRDTDLAGGGRGGQTKAGFFGWGASATGPPPPRASPPLVGWSDQLGFRSRQWRRSVSPSIRTRAPTSGRASTPGSLGMSRPRCSSAQGIILALFAANFGYWTWGCVGSLARSRFGFH